MRRIEARGDVAILSFPVLHTYHLVSLIGNKHYGLIVSAENLKAVLPFPELCSLAQ